MRIIVLILSLVSFAYTQTPQIEPGVSQELAKWRAAHYSDVRYKLDLTLEKMSPVLKGTIEVRVTLKDGVPIILDWRKIRGFEERSTISNVSLSGASHKFEESNEHLIFREGVVAGENIIRLEFTSPILPSGSAITRYVDKEDGAEYLYSLFVPSDASTAFPVFDQPDLKARFELTLYTPEGWKRISNSRGEDYSEVSSDREGTRYKSVFVETKPISTYVFAFAAGPFARVSAPLNEVSRNVKPELKEAYKRWLNTDVFIRLSAEAAARMRKERTDHLLRSVPPDDPDFAHVYVRKSQLAKFQPHAAEVFRLNREAVKYFEEYFDYKFPFPKYDLVLIPEFPFGGMEHAGATFLREAAIIFPSEPTKSDLASRATLIFHEAAHQWFGDTVTMRWFDDLWLKEGFANFTAYKAMEKIMPEMNAWKIFYERIKQGAYQTDSTKGTTAIYQPIPNLSAAKSAYGNIVYNKAPAFLRQAEFYLGEEKFRTAVRSFLKKHEFGNATWQDLVKAFEKSSDKDLKVWADAWVNRPGAPKLRFKLGGTIYSYTNNGCITESMATVTQTSALDDQFAWPMKTNVLVKTETLHPGESVAAALLSGAQPGGAETISLQGYVETEGVKFVFPNYQDYGYGIFLLDDKSRDYVLKNIQNEKDPFLRSMMWGALWDSVREGELDPKAYVELVIKVQSASFSSSGSDQRAEARTLNEDESTTATILNRVSTAMTYYIGDKDRDAIAPRLETMLAEKMRTAPTLGQRITYYRAFLSNVSTENGRAILKRLLQQSVPPASAGGSKVDTSSPSAHADGTDKSVATIPLKTKDRFDIVTKLASLGDPDAKKLLADLEKTETSDDAKRYAYAAKAGIATAENKAKYWADFTTNKEISESWIEAAFGPFNSVRHASLTLPYLERALQELPNHKRNRKIFFVNGWLGAFIGGQRSEEALAIVNKFLADNPNLDRDLRLKILENVDLIERAVKIRGKFAAR